VVARYGGQQPNLLRKTTVTLRGCIEALWAIWTHKYAMAADAVTAATPED
jgi:hypothetical protein